MSTITTLNWKSNFILLNFKKLLTHSEFLLYDTLTHGTDVYEKIVEAKNVWFITTLNFKITTIKNF
jgi:hypothetical protein